MIWASLGAQLFHLQCRKHRRCGFDPWVEKIPWRKAWQPIPVFLPGESHGQRSLVGSQRVGHEEQLTFTCKRMTPKLL